MKPLATARTRRPIMKGANALPAWMILGIAAMTRTTCATTSRRGRDEVSPGVPVSKSEKRRTSYSCTDSDGLESSPLGV